MASSVLQERGAINSKTTEYMLKTPAVTFDCGRLPPIINHLFPQTSTKKSAGEKYYGCKHQNRMI
jgi:hypothetical protein